MDDTIVVDLSAAQALAEKVRDTLVMMRQRYDLRRYEYTKKVRIAPTGPSCSHPVLTLNTSLRAENPILCNYLHEQMHWYLTWYSHVNTSGWQEIWRTIRRTYPSLPVGFPQGADDEHSSYLHIIVNYLEIEAAGDLLGPEVAREVAAKTFFYRCIYETVLRDWDALTALYRRCGLIPIRRASEMSEQDLHLTALMDEAPVG